MQFKPKFEDIVEESTNVKWVSCNKNYLLSIEEGNYLTFEKKDWKCRVDGISQIITPNEISFIKPDIIRLQETDNKISVNWINGVNCKFTKSDMLHMTSLDCIPE